jgi:hypothetical protein
VGQGLLESGSRSLTTLVIQQSPTRIGSTLRNPGRTEWLRWIPIVLDSNQTRLPVESKGVPPDVVPIPVVFPMDENKDNEQDC